MFKRVFYISLGLIVLIGVGTGLWLMRQEPQQQAANDADNAFQVNMSSKSVYQALGELETASHLREYLNTAPAFMQLEEVQFAIVFAPTKNALDLFIKDTALSVDRFLPYHVIVSQEPIDVLEGTKLKTQDGQEVVIVRVDNSLYVRDAKGNDSRLRRPVETSNGYIYFVDQVLLTQ